MGKGISSCNKSSSSKEVFDKEALEERRRVSRKNQPREIMSYQKDSEYISESMQQQISSTHKT